MTLSIAIDGPSASGKSTIAKLLANKLSVMYIDTGAMYRAITYYLIKNGVDLFSKEQIKNEIKNLVFDYRASSVYINGEVIDDDALRTPEVTAKVSQVSSDGNVRAFLVSIQRNLSEKIDVVMDGRDIGTNVLPNATVKFFLTANPFVRAQRRKKELEEKGIQVDFEKMISEIQKRDFQDSNRTINPLIKANDAIEVDTSDLGLEEVMMILLEKVEQYGKHLA